jgi:hypothetical protein
MKNDCAKWKDELLESALTGTAAGGLAQHLSSCARCAEELAFLRTRRENLDALLPLVARSAELAPGFRARVMAAVDPKESKPRPKWRAWALAGATVAVAAALLIGFTVHERTVRTASQSELAAAKKLAEWRAPSDVLLETPGREILGTTPRFGESYLHVPVKWDKEE